MDVAKFLILPLSLFGISHITNAEVLSASVQANVTQPLTLTETQPLNFSTILPNNLGDVIVISNEGYRSSTSGNSTFSGPFTRAKVNILGTPNASVNVQIDSTTTVTDANGNTMSVTDIDSNTLSPVLNANGLSDVFIGGKLHVAANQHHGLYDGTFNVTVNYQ